MDRNSRKKQNHYNRSVYRALALISQFGINMLVPIFLLSFLGIYLDRKLGTSWIVVLLFFVGALAGFRNTFVMAKHIYEDRNGKQNRENSKKTD